MNHDIIYRKVGRKYVPVGICQEPTWYPPGCSLVVVDKGCTSIQYQPSPRRPRRSWQL